jgi:hypothetical protein
MKRTREAQAVLLPVVDKFEGNYLREGRQAGGRLSSAAGYSAKR